MKTQKLICIVCPNGCQLDVTIEGEEEKKVTEITGYLCDKGPVWAEQEIINPLRTIASNIRVENGDFPLVSVRTDAPIPRESIPDVMKAIKAARVQAPVRIGDCLIHRPAHTNCAIIATRHIRQVLRDEAVT